MSCPYSLFFIVSSNLRSRAKEAELGRPCIVKHMLQRGIAKNRRPHFTAHLPRQAALLREAGQRGVSKCLFPRHTPAQPHSAHQRAQARTYKHTHAHFHTQTHAHTRMCARTHLHPHFLPHLRTRHPVCLCLPLLGHNPLIKAPLPNPPGPRPPRRPATASCCCCCCLRLRLPPSRPVQSRRPQPRRCPRLRRCCWLARGWTRWGWQRAWWRQCGRLEVRKPRPHKHAQSSSYLGVHWLGPT